MREPQIIRFKVCARMAVQASCEWRRSRGRPAVLEFVMIMHTAKGVHFQRISPKRFRASEVRANGAASIAVERRDYTGVVV